MPAVDDTKLTDLATLKGWLNLGPTDTAQDANLERLIVAVSETFKRMVRRPIFIVSSVIENYRGNGSSRIFLDVQPVVSVLYVKDANGTTLPVSGISSSLYQGAGYRVDELGIILEGRVSARDFFSISYIGGYTIESAEADIAEQAVLSLCTLWWKRKGHADEISRSLGQQITAKFTQEELAPETKAIIRILTRMT